MALCAATALAYDFSAVAPSGQTLYYNIVDGHAEVVRHTYVTGDLVIPSTVTYNDVSYTVTSIGSYAFSGCSGLTSVTIPDGVTSIGDDAFRGCSGLTSVTIPDGVTTIGNSAFRGCSGLTSVTIPDGVTSIGSGAFYGCSGLTSVAFNADSCTSAGSSSYWGYCAFNNCTSITNFTFGNNVKVIPAYLCYDLSRLTSVTIGSGVTSIGNYAFYGCSGLTEITSKAASAPILGTEAMTGVPSTITINIPCGSRGNYYSSRWNRFSNFIETTGFSINASSADTTMGTVSILAQPTCSSPTAEVNAVPNDGFRFNHWSDGNSDNPRSLTLTSDTAITAYFVAVIFIADVEPLNAKVYSSQGQIVVEGADGNTVWLYDVNGRVLATKHDEYTPLRFDVSVSGSYMIKIGNHAARKVVVLR